MDIKSTIIGLLSGLLIAIVGVYIAYLLENRKSKKFNDKQIIFDIYMKLLEIIGSYGKVAYFEKMNKDIDRNSREKLWNLSWQVADKLRLIDDYQYLDEILKVLFLINYKNAYDRFYELKKLIDKIGKDINPNYYHKTIKISDDNMDFIIKKPNFISTAPGDFY